jgi:hypothetical protein
MTEASAGMLSRDPQLRFVGLTPSCATPRRSAGRAAFAARPRILIWQRVGGLLIGGN